METQKIRTGSAPTQRGIGTLRYKRLLQQQRLQQQRLQQQRLQQRRLVQDQVRALVQGGVQVQGVVQGQGCPLPRAGARARVLPGPQRAPCEGLVVPQPQPQGVGASLVLVLVLGRPSVLVLVHLLVGMGRGRWVLVLVSVPPGHRHCQGLDGGLMKAAWRCVGLHVLACSCMFLHVPWSLGLAAIPPLH
jgi:hypothetical protein